MHLPLTNQHFSSSSYTSSSTIHTIFYQISDKLSKTVLALQSDQILQQMRNDKTLYQYKLTHIKQLIDQHLNIQTQITQLIQQNQKLKQELGMAQDKLVKKDREFAESIDNIEESAKKLTQMKDQEIGKLNFMIKNMEAKLNNKIDNNQKNSKKLSQLTHSIQQLQQDRQKLRKQSSKLKQQLNKLLQQNKKLKVSYKQHQSQNEKSVSLIKKQYEKQIEQYQNLLKKMQNDMLVIKGQWQKKCNDIEKNLRQFYQNQIIKLQQKKSRELLLHIDNIKEGKPVVIKQDQQILTSRIQSVRRQYQNQIQKVKKNNTQLTEMFENLQNSQLPRIKQIQSLTQALKNIRNQFEIQKEDWKSQKQKSKREIQKFKAILLQFQRNSKDAILNSQAKQSQIIKLKDNIKFIENKLQIANRNLIEQKSIKITKEDQLQTLKQKFNSLDDINKKNRKKLQNMEAQIQSRNKTIQSLTKQIQILSQKQTQLIQKQTNLKAQLKATKANKLKYRKLLDKMHIQLKQSQKQITLLKQDIKYSHQLYKKKNIKDLQKIIDQIQLYKQNVQKDTKIKMTNFINQIQQAKEAQHQQFQIVFTERQNLKRQIVQLEQLFVRKQKQVQDAKKNIMNAQTDQIRRNMIEQLQRERVKYQRLEQQLLENERSYHKKIDKTKNQVKDAIRVLTSKWMEEIGKLQQDNKKKQLQLQRIFDKAHKVINQNEQIKTSYQNEKDQTKRLRKKYDTLKQQKQQQMTDLIKRLERESKNKINLQKQLRSIRLELNKGDKYTQRQNKSGSNNSVTDREKEITQIRQLIAKTYQVVGQKPQKDKDFKFQRKRSPF